MRTPHLNLSVYPCEKCAGPVNAGAFAVGGSEVCKGNGAICLWCGHRQDRLTDSTHPRHLRAVAWEPVSAARLVP
jgi:hypothetical protein